MAIQHDLIETCEECSGPVDTNEPGHYKSPDERFRHGVCHEKGVPDGYVLNNASEYPMMASVNRQFNCGHVAYGPPRELPTECPECGDNAV